jgi:hypothetical protein
MRTTDLKHFKFENSWSADVIHARTGNFYTIFSSKIRFRKKKEGKTGIGNSNNRESLYRNIDNPPFV